ncbi:uncharacterized protein LOC111912534 [Lactuca sativa]|uniref:uncharacterized protein LOC111912534 n=1 Tax=Lactuca sativa TaxID=4236 RepID=UPI000CD83FB7|nr:uncharacterized protein LOC111912534 [Lactuca sativa]
MAGDIPEGSGKKSDEGIDTTSLFYIHPSDYPKQVQELTNFLLAKNKIGLIDGTVKKPKSTSPTYKAWVRADAMIKGWLTTAMEREIRTSVRYANTSSEIWPYLEERFEKEGVTRAYELKKTLYVTRHDGSSVSNYYTKLRSIWDELQMVLPTPRFTYEGCNSGISKQLNELREKERTYEFLMGLDKDFAVIRTQVLAMKLTPSIGTVYHLLAEDE